MSGPRGMCTYGPSHAAEFPWSEAVPKNSSRARCKLCTKIIDISSMGWSALVSHASGQKHKRFVNAAKNTLSVAAVLKITGTSSLVGKSHSISFLAVLTEEEGVEG